MTEGMSEERKRLAEEEWEKARHRKTRGRPRIHDVPRHPFKFWSEIMNEKRKAEK